MLYKEWIDFVVFPSNPNKILTREQRVNTTNAVRFESEEYKNFELVHQRGFVYTKDRIIFDDDKLEAMAINSKGDVCIWTETRVWTLLRRFGDMEKLIYVPRNPDSSEVS